MYVESVSYWKMEAVQLSSKDRALFYSLPISSGLDTNILIWYHCQCGSMIFSFQRRYQILIKFSTSFFTQAVDTETKSTSLIH